MKTQINSITDTSTIQALQSFISLIHAWFKNFQGPVVEFILHTINKILKLYNGHVLSNIDLKF